MYLLYYFDIKLVFPLQTLSFLQNGIFINGNSVTTSSKSSGSLVDLAINILCSGSRWLIFFNVASKTRVEWYTLDDAVSVLPQKGVIMVLVSWNCFVLLAFRVWWRFWKNCNAHRVLPNLEKFGCILARNSSKSRKLDGKDWPTTMNLTKKWIIFLGMWLQIFIRGPKLKELRGKHRYRLLQVRIYGWLH